MSRRSLPGTLTERGLPALDCTYGCTYNQSVKFEWDPAKAAGNLKKHRIDFADAALVLYDDLAVTVPDEDAEERFVTLGTDALGHLLVVVYTWQDERIRLISARRATGRERRRYEGQS